MTTGTWSLLVEGFEGMGKKSYPNGFVLEGFDDKPRL